MAQIYVPSPEYLKKYTAAEIEKRPDGRIYLKEGVEKRWEDSGRSLAGTLPPERELPEEPTGDIANFKQILRTAALSARASTRPTASDELNRYAQGGVAMTTPANITSALKAGTLGRAEVEQNIFAGVSDLIKQQEERQKQTQQFASDLLTTISKDPALMTSLTGEDFELIKQGVVTPDLMGRIAQAAQAPKTLEAIKDSGVLLPDADYDRIDTSMGLPKGTSKQIAEISATEKRLRVAGLAQDIQGKTVQQASDLFNALGNIPAGTPVEIDGNTYYGLMGTGKLEIDSGGFGRMLTVNPFTGQQQVKDLGFIGRTQDGWQLNFNDDGEPWRFNTKTGDLVYAGDASDGSTPNAVGADWESVIPTGTIGGQCGTFVRKLTGIHVGDTLESKKAVIDKEIGRTKPIQVGDAIIMNIGTYGHIGIVEAIITEPPEGGAIPGAKGRQQIKIMDSNINLDERVSHRWIKSDDGRIEGFARGNLSPSLAYGPDAPTQVAQEAQDLGAQRGIGAGPGGKSFGTKTSTAKKGDGKLSAPDAKVMSIVSTLQSDIDTLKLEFSRNYKGTIGGIMTGTNPKYRKLAYDIADKVLRLRTGATAPEQEVQRFMKQIFSLSDLAFGSAEIANENLDRFKEEARIIAEGLGGTPAAVTTGDSGLREKVKAKGFNYDKMKSDGLTDEQIKSKLKL